LQNLNKKHLIKKFIKAQLKKKKFKLKKKIKIEKKNLSNIFQFYANINFIKAHNGCKKKKIRRL
jgi:hypothetical protein